MNGMYIDTVNVAVALVAQGQVHVVSRNIHSLSCNCPEISP